MITIKEFMDVQNSILERDFVRSDVAENGITPYIEEGDETVSYGMLLWHPYDVARKVEDFSYKISKTAPSIPCAAKDAHVGLVVYNGCEGGELVLRKLCEAVRKAARSDKFRRPRMNYNSWFCTRNSVVAAGRGYDAIDDHFVGITNGILNNYSGSGLERKKLAQITSNRFTEARNPEDLSKFLK